MSSILLLIAGWLLLAPFSFSWLIYAELSNELCHGGPSTLIASLYTKRSIGCSFFYRLHRLWMRKRTIFLRRPCWLFFFFLSMGISLSLFSTDFNLGSLAIHVGPWRWWYIFSSHSRSVSYTWAPVWAGWYLSSRVTVSTDAFIPDRSPIDKEREREKDKRIPKMKTNLKLIAAVFFLRCEIPRHLRRSISLWCHWWEDDERVYPCKLLHAYFSSVKCIGIDILGKSCFFFSS